jgi:flagellar FliL protein
MAEKKQVKETGDTAAAAGSNPRRKKLLLIGAGAASVLLLLGVLGWMFLGGEKEPAPEPAAAAPAEAIYVALGKKMQVSLQSGGRPHYLQVELSVLTREQAVVEDLGLHAPLLQSRIGALLGAQDFERLRTEEGKLALRAELLALVQEILSAETGKPGVEQVFFTDFVLQ